MKLRVRLFAGARKIAGADSLQLDVPDDSTVAALRAALSELKPSLAPLLRGTRFAVNLEFVREESRIPSDAEVALIPPVSGG